MIDGIQIAKIFGPIFIILGLWELLRTKNAIAYAKEWGNNPIILTMAGFLNLLMGFTIVTYFNEWEWNLGILVTLLGWCAIIKGLLIFFYPKLATKFKFNKQTVLFGGIFVLLWGAGLCYWGYFL